MIKDMIISGLSAVYVLKISWFADCDQATKISIWLATTVCLFIFLLFLEQIYEKRLQYKERVRKIQEEVKRLRYEKREIAGNSKATGRKP